jgi:hypothetical protein
MSKHGESGWLAEERLFAGWFLIYWNDEKEEGNLATIDDVVLSDGSGSWVIGESSQWCWLYDGADFSEDVNVATKLLSSLQSPKLDWPARCTLTPYLPTSGSARARLTETNKPMSTTAMASTPIGLGVNFGHGAVSFIGDDRRTVATGL